MLSIQLMGDATCLEGAATWWSSLFVKVLLAACPIKSMPQYDVALLAVVIVLLVVLPVLVVAVVVDTTVFFGFAQYG